MDDYSTPELIKAYGGEMSSTASSRQWLNIEPNISVRDSFSERDYYHFRPGESVNDSNFLKKSADAYRSVGLIKNIIDLMGDFASQGVRISHENKSIEKFYQRWWEKVKGDERTERFANQLYRLGNVPVYRAFGKISKKDSKVSIPFKYEILNPTSMEAHGENSVFGDTRSYNLKISVATRKHILKTGKGVTPEVLNSLKGGAISIPLDMNRLSLFFYKKDDWQIWADPLIQPILDDITMLEKMKLADMAALDGAVSSIRLWRIGSLDHKITPNKGAIDRLRSILAANVGGGTMDLVWGPEIDFKESNTQIYKFLGSEKYGPVLNSIYGGAGIPQTLTGSSGGGFSDNFLSLKTLIEKLEYGRDIITSFWREEFELVAKAMGFSSPAELKFDQMILSDEAAEKNLWIQLSDRGIISTETLRQRFGESDLIEESRIKTESGKRKKGIIPQKADPYHNGNTESEYVKLALGKDTLSIEDVTDYKARVPPAVKTVRGGNTKKQSGENGRPPFKTDTQTRKSRRVLPRSKANLSTTALWAYDTQKKIAHSLNPIFLHQYGKATLRELSKKEQDELELIKYSVLCNIAEFSEITDEVILLAMEADHRPVDTSSFYRSFLDRNGRQPSIEETRQIYCLAYSCSRN